MAQDIGRLGVFSRPRREQHGGNRGGTSCSAEFFPPGVPRPVDREKQDRAKRQRQRWNDIATIFMLILSFVAALVGHHYWGWMALAIEAIFLIVFGMVCLMVSVIREDWMDH